MNQSTTDLKAKGFIEAMSDPKEKKKRGRPRLSDKAHNSNIILEKKKRGRRKKNDTDSLHRVLGDFDSGENRLSFESETKDSSNRSSNNVLFGGLNIKVHSAKPVDTSDLRKMLSADNSTCLLGTTNTNEDLEIKTHIPSNFKVEKREHVTKNIYHYKEFVDNNDNEWPRSTNIACMWCTYPFDGVPIPMPYKFDDKRKRFKVYGIYCSFGCCKARSFAMNDQSCWRRSSLISYVFKQMYGHMPLDGIKVAPDRECLIKYGGTMTIEEFREASSNGEDLIIKIPTFVMDTKEYNLKK